MKPKPLRPPVDDLAPQSAALTDYDREHLITYLRLLDAEADGADWREVAQIVLGLDAAAEPERAQTAWRSHLARAQWMTASGYQALLQDAATN